MRVAVVEWTTSGSDQNRIAKTHYAWRHAGATTSRILLERNCALTGCPTESSTVPTVMTHGQGVAAAIGASIEAGQDPGQTTTAARVARSGVAPGVEFTYYRVNGCSALDLAIQQALFDGASVVNDSNEYGTGTTPPHTHLTDCGGVNAALRGFVDYEGVFVHAAGNSTHIGYPGTRPESITVAGLDTRDNTIAYGAITGFYPGSGSGTISVVVNGTTMYGAQKPVVVGAPAYVALLPSIPLASYIPSGGWFEGTSIASPIVAGIATLFKDGMGGGGASNGRLILSAILAMGDGWSGSGSGVLVTGTSSNVGSGRIRALRPTFYGYRTFSISQGQEVCWDVANGAVLNGYSGWKWGLTWKEPDLSQAADLDLRVRDINTNLVLYSQSDYAIHNRVRLNASQIAGKRLRACVYGYSVPSGQARTVYTTDFVHSNAGD